MLIIGLVNNMPDAALRRTERQFRELLGGTAAGAGHPGQIVLPAGGAALGPGEDVSRRNSTSRSASLWDNPVDGLIVTGTEPRAPVLTDEPYWRSLTALVDWAREQHRLDDLVVPGRARRGAAPRRHRAPPAGGKAVRRVRVPQGQLDIR